MLSVVAAYLATAAPAVAAAGRVAVLEFRDKVPQEQRIDAAYLSDQVRSAVKELLPRAGIIDRENMLVLLQSTGRKLEECEGECEVDTGRRIGADLVISGELLRFGTQYKLNMKLHDTRTGELLAGAVAAGAAADDLDRDIRPAVGRLLAPLVSEHRGAGGALLSIACRPQASVQLDGQDIGVTPIQRRPVEPGAHLVLLTARGYHAASRTVDVHPGEEVSVTETLFHEAGALEVASLEGATLTVDGEPVHAGRVDGLAVGPHAVRAELKGYRAAERTVTIENGTTARVTLEPQPLPRRVVVIPSLAASCSLDGGASQEGQPDRPTTFEASVGVHELTCQRRGFARFAQSVSVRPGSDVVVNAHLAEGGPAAGDVRKDARIGLASIFVPGATFEMGCVRGDRQCATDERPTRTVTVGSFWLTRTEVDAEAYRRCVEAGACTAPDTGPESCNYGRRPDHPVNCVDWTQAGDYCRWAGGTLPTAAEWEYAARSGVPAPYPWGTEAPNAAYARFDSLDGTAPVASYEKGTSRWGFVDLAGNVAEWTASDYSLKEKEVRGGSWTDTGRNLRVSARSAQKPGSRSDVIGFRCAFHEVQASQPP